jgi:hypothetical protein
MFDEAESSVGWLFAKDPAPRTSSKLLLPEAAAFLRVSHRSLDSRAWRQKLGIPTLHCGRRVLFDRDDLNEWLAHHTEKT